MFSLKALVFTVALVVAVLVFLYCYVRKKNEFGYIDVVLITGLLWGCGFVFTVTFGGVILMIMQYVQKIIDHLLKYL
jgi:hypothetical protein